jgi:hypothetical protein
METSARRNFPSIADLCPRRFEGADVLFYAFFSLSISSLFFYHPSLEFYSIL